MHLWTEYEGRTIAEHYTLGKLLRSEGRNGFFATAGKDGHPAVIRLTEAHFDEDEQLHRWRQVAEVHQDNLIEIEQVGRTTFEGVPLTYALMEPDDANLGDVLKERPLTTAETTQVATSVLAALAALHGRGLVHEHVGAENVLAVGETVKLRSDCVRECVADGEFTTEEACADLRRKDIHDYGTLLLRCLTLETELTPALHLPEPFLRIVPGALEQGWSLQQIGTALNPAAFAPKPAAPAQPVQPASSGPLPPTATPITPETNVTPQVSHRPLVPPGVLPAGTHSAEPAIPMRKRYGADLPDEEPGGPAGPARGTLIAAGAALLVVVLLLWYLLGGSKPAKTAPLAAGPRSRAVPSAQTTVPAVSPEAPAPIAAALRPEATAVSGAHGWYVIAFTYNHESQAQTKVDRLRRNHTSLHPQLFTPSGSAPFFVSLGGPMPSEDAAEAVYRHARRSGLPRDTFVRRY